MKLICIGNRFINPDGAALWLFDEAVQKQWPQHVQWIEGGLGGLNLMLHFDTSDQVYILDYVPSAQNAHVLPLQDILINKPLHYDHSSAFYFLLHSLPDICVKQPKVSILACDPMSTSWKEELYDLISELSSEC